VRVHSLTLSFTPGLPLLAHNLASPCLGHKPKAKVATFFVIMNVFFTIGFFSWRFTKLANFLETTRFGGLDAISPIS
jgi:hypothetical protein